MEFLIKNKIGLSINKPIVEYHVYVEYAITFQKQKIGICVQTKDIVQADDRCEQFLSRPQQTKAATLEHLDFVIRDIEVLENIFYDYKD